MFSLKVAIVVAIVLAGRPRLQLPRPARRLAPSMTARAGEPACRALWATGYPVGSLQRADRPAGVPARAVAHGRVRRDRLRARLDRLPRLAAPGGGARRALRAEARQSRRRDDRRDRRAEAPGDARLHRADECALCRLRARDAVRDHPGRRRRRKRGDRGRIAARAAAGLRTPALPDRHPERRLHAVRGLVRDRRLGRDGARGPDGDRRVDVAALDEAAHGRRRRDLRQQLG